MEFRTGEEAVPDRLPGLPLLFLRTKKVGENIFEVRFAKRKRRLNPTFLPWS